MTNRIDIITIVSELRFISGRFQKDRDRGNFNHFSSKGGVKVVFFILFLCPIDKFKSRYIHKLFLIWVVSRHTYSEGPSVQGGNDELECPPSLTTC